MSLLTLQRDMIAWLREGAEPLAERIGGGPGPDVYLNNHRAALMAALSNGYGQLRLWMGDAAFDSAAAHHVERSAPSSWTLDSYGHDFADTLSDLCPDDAELPDLARLEWALGEAFTAPDAAALDIGALAQVDWETAVLRPVPSAVVLDIATNADAILAAMTAGETPPAAEGTETPAAILIWRQDFIPRFRPMEAEEWPLFGAAAPGISFADLCAAFANRLGTEQGVARAGTLLARWAGEGSCRLV